MTSSPKPSPEEQAFAMLSAARGPGLGKINRLLAEGKNPEEILAMQDSSTYSLDQLKESLDKIHARFVARNSPEFPAGRLAVLDKDLPLGLYTRGKLDLSEALEGLTVAIVGSRRCTDYGRKTAFELSSELAGRGATVISGLALGIDAQAHRGALEAGGKTLAILGPGVDVVYPTQNRELFDEVIANGLLVSETPPGRKPEGYLFPLRNRLISALADAVVVVESLPRGGAMITAKIAQKQNRPLFAVPGRIDQGLSEGPNSLLREGAKPIFSAQDIFTALAPKSAQSDLPFAKPKRLVLPPNCPSFFAPLVEGDTLCAEEIAARAKVELKDVLSKLLEYELLGSVAKNLDGTYAWRG